MYHTFMFTYFSKAKVFNMFINFQHSKWQKFTEYKKTLVVRLYFCLKSFFADKLSKIDNIKGKIWDRKSFTLDFPFENVCHLSKQKKETAQKFIS